METGRDWGVESQATEHWGPPQAGRGKGNPPLEASEGFGRAGSFISDSGLQSSERISFCCLSRRFVGLCYDSPRTLIIAPPKQSDNDQPVDEVHFQLTQKTQG